MFFKKNLSQLNIVAQCRKNGLPIYQCPQIIFLVMGIIIIGTMTSFYAIGMHWIEDPATVALIISIITIVLLILSFIITRSFERLAEASRMKTEFINVISHQLRSPLTNLKWATDFLKTAALNKLDESETEFFYVLEENCKRMNELINNLLTVSRIEQKRLIENKENVSLPKLLKEIIKETNVFAIASNVRIKTEIGKKIPEIYCTRSLIKTVIENLINNAIHYSSVKDNSEPQKNLVEIKLNERGKNIYLEIQDYGIGIPEEDKKFIFEKFFRSKNVSKHQTRGSGLGLFIAKSIVKKMNGKIGFQSEQNQGTTFWFTLPIKKLKLET